MMPVKNMNGDSHFPQRLKNFFRINSSTNRDHKDRGEKDHHGLTTTIRPDNKSPFRPGSKFFNVGRLRSATVASEGNPLDEAMSPTAHANPYFAHQGQPGLRHHNAGSVPPSPPDTPVLKVDGTNGAAAEQAMISTKEELARKLRRVASAPNAQGLFSKGKGSGERPATAELSKEPLAGDTDANTIGFPESKLHGDMTDSLGVPDSDGLGALPAPSRTPLAFRRTYSSNSIKVRDVEVGPQSFDKIKLIGKGDVGKVYLVREKKSSRLYAMKGTYSIGPNDTAHTPLSPLPPFLPLADHRSRSPEQEGDDQA